LCCVVLCCVVLCCVVLCCVVLCCVVLCCVVLCCVVLCCVLSCCVTLWGVVWCGVVLWCVVCCAVLCRGTFTFVLRICDLRVVCWFLVLGMCVPYAHPDVPQEWVGHLKRNSGSGTVALWGAEDRKPRQVGKCHMNLLLRLVLLHSTVKVLSSEESVHCFSLCLDLETHIVLRQILILCQILWPAKRIIYSAHRLCPRPVSRCCALQHPCPERRGPLSEGIVIALVQAV
jgi:hypothetical protein